MPEGEFGDARSESGIMQLLSRRNKANFALDTSDYLSIKQLFSQSLKMICLP